MRKLVPATAALLLVITACGGSDGSESSSIEDQIKRETWGCEDGESTDDCEQRYRDEIAMSVEDDSEAESDHAEADDQVSDNERASTGRTDSDVTLSIGETADVDQGPFADFGDYVGSITLENVEHIESCDGGSRDVTAEGDRQLVQATFTLDASDAESTFDFTQSDFEARDDEAVNSESSSLADGDVWLCQDILGLPDVVEAGESGERVLIFELPTQDSEITYTGGVFNVTWTQGNDTQTEEEDATATDESASASDLPSADEVDFYSGNFSHPDELMVDISTIQDCETADIIWGGFFNAEIEGLEVNQEYLADLEEWMQGNGCW